MSKDLKDIIEKEPNGTEGGDTDIDSGDLRSQLNQKILERYQSDTHDRRWLAKWTAIVVSIWLLLVYGILVLNDSHVHLSETVLITLISTTTLNVIGLPLVVLRGHFKSDN